MKTAILLFLASLSALAQTATFNAVKLTGPVTATNNAITAKYATDRVGQDIPTAGSQSGFLGLPMANPMATSSTFSGWGEAVVATNTWDTVELYLYPFSQTIVPSTVIVRVRQMPADTSLWTNNPTTWTVLAEDVLAVTPVPGVFNRIVASFEAQFSHTNSLWLEYETNGREGGRSADNTNTNLVPNPPGRWYTTGTTLAGSWVKATANLPFFAKYTLSSGALAVDPSSAAMFSALPVPSKANTVINLPDTLYALEGREMNLYFPNFIWGFDGLNGIKVSLAPGAPGRQFGNWGGYWRHTPTNVTATNTLVFIARDNAMNPLAARTVTLLTRPLAYPASAVSRKVHLIGDSTLGGSGSVVLAELVRLFDGDANYAMTLVGSNTGTTSDSLGINRTVACDAISGWTASMFFTNSSTTWTTIGGSARTGSPFVFGGSFNYSTFLSTNSITMTTNDIAIVHLGINDIFSAISQEEAEFRITTCTNMLENIIQGIRSAVPGIRTAVCITIPPNAQEEAWGVDYTSSYPPWSQYQQNRRSLAQAIVARFNGRTASGIHCVAYAHSVDTFNNFNTTATAVNARNSTTYLRPNAGTGVHPSPSGYYQLADTLRAFLKGIE